MSTSVSEVSIGTREAKLPPGFEDLEDLMAWSLPTEEERYQKRLGSTIEELQAFYDRMKPRAAAARDYLDQFGDRGLPIDAQRLIWILFSMINASYAVDVFGAPQVPDTGSVYVKRTGEPSTAGS